MRTILLILILFFSFSGFSQLKQKMADQHFARMEYYQCVDMYNELANKTLRGKGVKNLENVRRAAVSNYKLFQMKQAAHYFKSLESKTSLTEEDYEYYIQALRFEENYKEAESIIHKAQDTYSENNYFSNLKTNLKAFNDLFRDSSLASIDQTKINSQYGDFSPVYYEDGLIYATKSKNTQVLNGRSKWDNSFFVSLLQTQYESDSSLQNGKLLRHQFLDKGHDGPVAFTKDEQKMVITKNIFGKKKGKDVIVLALYFSEKKDGKWGDLTPFPYNSDYYSTGHGVFSEDGNTLYFVSDMDGGFGKTDIYRSHWENGQWSKPENLGETINTDQNEMFPFVIGNKLYFSSNGHFGLGGLDLFEVDLNTVNAPKNLGYPVNSSADDFGLITQEKERLKGYFTSNRKDNIDKIYSFERRVKDIELIVSIFEKYDVNEAVPQQAFTFLNKTTQEEDVYYTNHEGKLSLTVDADTEYELSTEKEDFILLQKETVKTHGIDSDSSLHADLYLLPTTITIAVRIVAKDTKLPLDSARATVSNKDLDLDTTLITNSDGLALLEVVRDATYFVEGSKKGYIDANVDFTTSGRLEKIVNLELDLSPIRKGETFKLDNIFYDFDKATLRPESMRSLDKLADFIVENNLKIELSSHTDSRGSAAYNQNLSQKRAQSCVNYLLTRNVKKSQIIAKGYGESQLLNHCKDGVKCSEDEHQENRRTEVKILDY